jgi:ubiquinol-cytochrome c reductase cytochrome b subunit
VRVTKRTTAIAIVLLLGIGWAGLTTAAIASTPKEARTAEVDYSAPTDWMQLSPEEMAGVAYFRQENCESCHAVGGRGGNIGPDLTKTGVHKDAAWMIQHFKAPASMRPGSSMPSIQLTDAQLSSLAAFLLKLNERNASALENAPEFAAQGAVIYQANHCNACHMVNGVGQKLGPVLNGLSKRQSKSWVIDHFKDPQKLAPGTIMPPYKLPQKDLDTLTAYLFALPDVQ